jgi:hypothetical protein
VEAGIRKVGIWYLNMICERRRRVGWWEEVGNGKDGIAGFDWLYKSLYPGVSVKSEQ